MSDAHILIIEDEADLLELEEYHLSKAGYTVTGFLSTHRVEDLLEEETIDLMIVDRNLPGVEGSEFVKHLRSMGYDIPVVFVTARDQQEDIAQGFERGGDDYLTKPFNMEELLWRIQAILRRTQGTKQGILSHREITLDLDRHTCTVSGMLVELSRLEFNLLQFFLQNPGIVLSREQLLESAWEESADTTQLKTVNVAINRLLQKIDPDKEHHYITPVRGIGYRL